MTSRETTGSLAAFLDLCGGLELGEVGETGQLVLHGGFGGTLHALEVYLREVHLRLKVYEPSSRLQHAVSGIGHRQTWLT